MKQLIQHQAEEMSGVTAGVTLVGTGTGGSLIQTITEWSNIAVAWGNAVLILGGLYLMWIKIKESRRRDRRDRDRSTDKS